MKACVCRICALAIPFSMILVSKTLRLMNHDEFQIDVVTDIHLTFSGVHMTSMCADTLQRCNLTERIVIFTVV